MRGELQGKNECLLATIADLTKTPMAQVRATALAYSGKSHWDEIYEHITNRGQIDDFFWKVAFYLCDVYDPTKKLAHAIIKAAGTTQQMRDACTAATLLDSSITELPAKGRGVIVLLHVWGRGHIVPWEDGLAYDPNLPGVGDTLDWLKFRYIGFYIHGITQV